MSTTAKTESGREFSIGKKVYTLQRNLTDGSWDIDLLQYGWQSTNFPIHTTAAQAEAMARSNLKGGAKRFMARRYAQFQ